MKKIAILILFFFIASVNVSYAGLFGDILKVIGISTREESDDNTIISGLKEALSIGTEIAVKNVSKVDGYFGNQLIKILMPEKIRNVADILRQVGYRKEVDEFVLSMNRAAEKAAPQALSIFVDAIKDMTFEDAKGILNGGDTAATEFFNRKTHDKIYNAFKPIISSSMDEVGVTRSYKEMIGKYEAMPLYEAIPFIDKESVDLDHYVTNKAIDGLFYMIGQEEKKIRTNPAARVTDLLKTVFGK